MSATGCRPTPQRLGSLSSKVLISVLLLRPVLGQSPQQPILSSDTQQSYAKLCGGCHGADARGTQQGPGLAGSPSVRARSEQNLRSVIRNGIPSAGMPGFDLPAAGIDGSRKSGCVVERFGRGEHRSWRSRGRQAVFF